MEVDDQALIARAAAIVDQVTNVFLHALPVPAERGRLRGTEG
jgi:hypothetical protein